MAIIIGRIMGQRSQSEGVLIQVLGFADQVEDKIADPDIMRQIAEKLAAERIIPQILNNAPSVSESVRFGQLFHGGGRKSFEQQRFDRTVPRRIDNSFVGKNRI